MIIRKHVDGRPHLPEGGVFGCDGGGHIKHSAQGESPTLRYFTRYEYLASSTMEMRVLQRVASSRLKPTAFPVCRRIPRSSWSKMATMATYKVPKVENENNVRWVHEHSVVGS